MPFWVTRCGAPAAVVLLLEDQPLPQARVAAAVLLGPRHHRPAGVEEAALPLEVAGEALAGVAARQRVGRDVRLEPRSRPSARNACSSGRPRQVHAGRAKLPADLTPVRSGATAGNVASPPVVEEGVPEIRSAAADDRTTRFDGVYRSEYARMLRLAYLSIGSARDRRGDRARRLRPAAHPLRHRREPRWLRTYRGRAPLLDVAHASPHGARPARTRRVRRPARRSGDRRDLGRAGPAATRATGRGRAPVRRGHDPRRDRSGPRCPDRHGAHPSVARCCATSGRSWNDEHHERDELEGRLRHTLLRHADTIDGDVPTFAPTPTAADPMRPRRRLTAFVAAAAAVALVAVGVAVVRGSGDGGSSGGQQWSVHFGAFDRPQVATDTLPADVSSPEGHVPTRDRPTGREHRRRGLLGLRATNGWICLVQRSPVPGESGAMGCGAVDPRGRTRPDGRGCDAAGRRSWPCSCPTRPRRPCGPGRPDTSSPYPTDDGVYHQEWAPGRLPSQWEVAFEATDGSPVVFRFRGGRGASGGVETLMPMPQTAG